MDEADDACIKILDEWIKSRKNILYDKHIVNAPSESPDNFLKYEEALETFANPLIKAVDSEEIDILKQNEWPSELLECIKDSNTKVLIKDTIEKWCKQYPYVNCKPQILELENEHKGINP